MLQNYLPVFVFIFVALFLGVMMITLGLVVARFMGHQRSDLAKQSAYECGFEAFENARIRFDVRYYLVAILFIIFDLEIVYLFPWAVVLNDVGMAGFWAMMIFLGILVVGFIYEWRSGVLEWE